MSSAFLLARAGSAVASRKIPGMVQAMKLNLSAFSKSFSPGLKHMPPNPWLHPKYYGWLRQSSPSGELKP